MFMNIITKSDLQKNIGQLKGKAYTVVNRGKPEFVLLPYFEGADDMIENYIEDFEMYINRKNLDKELKESLESGVSDLII